MRHRNLQNRIVFRSRTFVMIVAVLALVVLNVFDIHAPGLTEHEAAAEFVLIDDDTSSTNASTEADESHYCETTVGCHVGLEVFVKQSVWTGPGDPIFATPFDLVGSSSLNGLFRPPIRA